MLLIFVLRCNYIFLDLRCVSFLYNCKGASSFCTRLSHKIRELNPNNSFLVMNRTPNYSVDQSLTELNPNNLRISRIFSRTIFLLSCKTEISSLNNSESLPIIPELFPNHELLTSPNRPLII